MADYYTIMCFAIDDVTNQEYKWLKDMTEKLQFGDSSNEDGIPELDGFVPDWAGWTLTTEVTAIDGDVITNDNVKGTVYFEAEENFNCDALTVLLQHFLQKFRPDCAITFEMAHSCSKMRVDAFGGGAVFITADDVQYFSTAMWVYDRLNEFRDRLAKGQNECPSS